MQVLGSPFRVMKILSEYFGYTVPVCPIEGGLVMDQFTYFELLTISWFRPGAVRCRRAKNLHIYHTKLGENCSKMFLFKMFFFVCWCKINEIKCPRWWPPPGELWGSLGLRLVTKFRQCQWLGSSRRKFSLDQGTYKIRLHWKKDFAFTYYC